MMMHHKYIIEAIVISLPLNCWELDGSSCVMSIVGLPYFVVVGVWDLLGNLLFHFFEKVWWATAELARMHDLHRSL
jgi:uncharacterized membrane protein